MISLVTCKKQNSLQKEYRDQLELAKGRIKDFANLNLLFSNFDIYRDIEFDKKSKNLIFNVCIRKPQTVTLFQKSVTFLVDNLYYPHILEELEDALKFFDILGWNSSKLNRLKSDITRPDLHISSVAIYEILIPFNIGLKIGKQNVVIQDKLSSGKVSDFSILLNGRKIFFELNSLSKGKSEQKIESICQDLIEYINNTIKKLNYLLFTYFDTKFLLNYADSLGQIDEALAKESLHTEIDRLKLEELIGCEGKINFDSLH